MGRKNFYGTASKRGAWVTSVMYSLVETAKLSRVDPTRWLLAIIDAAQRDPEAVVLPWDLQA